MLKGQISIFHPRGTDCDYIQIEVVDALSRTHFLQVRLSCEDFAKAITGQNLLPCRFELRAQHVGMIVEHKVVKVFVPDGDFSDREIIARRAVLVHEKDGWSGRVDDALNHHKLAGGRVEGGAFYNVIFSRYVKEKLE